MIGDPTTDMTEKPTGPDPRRLKLRSLIDTYWTLIFVVLLVVTMVGVGLTYGAYGQTQVEPVEEVESSWTQEIEYTHSATVVRANPLFPVGSEFTNAQTYLSQIAPEAQISVASSYQASQAEDVRVRAESDLIVRSVEQQIAGPEGEEELSGPGGEPTEYWRDERSLDDVEAENVQPGEAVEHDFELNVSQIEAQIEEIEQTVGSTPGDLDIRIVTTVTIEGTIDGHEETYSRTVEAPIAIDADTYSITNPNQGTDRIERTTTDLVEREPGPVRSLGGPMVIFGGVAGMVIFGVGRLSGWFRLSDREQEHLTYLIDREEYAEWIKRVKLPDEARDKPVGQADSLADLARLAIDAEVPLLQEPGTEQYHAVTNNYHYTFDPPAVENADDGDDHDSDAEKILPFSGESGWFDKEMLSQSDDDQNEKQDTTETE